ncbi:hypothetical protein MNJPNG_08955 [Cupriavidus oxalaticus]
MEAAAAEALTESDAPEAPIEAMPSEATTEAVAEAPVEVLATANRWKLPPRTN